MASRPRIAILGSYEHDKAHIIPGYPRIIVNADYQEAVTMAGGLTFIIGPQTSPELVEPLLELADGVLFVGGADVQPRLYRQDPLPECGEPEELRDEFEALAYKAALARKLPMFGVCRGLQFFNVMEGGTLFQDLKYRANTNKHEAAERPEQLMHSIRYAAGSFVEAAFGEAGEVWVNSLHHQVIAELAPSFKAVAKASDGVIEAIVREGDCFVGAVQWHPEMLFRRRAGDLNLFKYFVEQARKRAK